MNTITILNNELHFASMEIHRHVLHRGEFDSCNELKCLRVKSVMEKADKEVEDATR